MATVGLLTRTQLQQLDTLLKTLPSFKGDFFDPFDVQLDWSLEQCALFLSWWCFIPGCCTVCGNTARWMPSLEDEYRCPLCATGAGNTKTNEIVDEVNYAENAGEESDDDVEGMGGLAGMPDMNFLAASEQFLQVLKALWKQTRIIEQQHNEGPPGVSPALRASSRHSTPATEDPDQERYQPRAIDLPTILRVAINLVHLSLLPDTHTSHSEGDDIIKYGCLYLSCLLADTDNVHLFSEFQRVVPCDLQWIDVISIATDLGLQDYCTIRTFTLREEMIQLMALFEEKERPPGVVWMMGSLIPGQEEYVKSLLKHKQKEAVSPELTLAVVCFELLRKFEADEKERPEYKKLHAWKDRNKSKQFTQLLDSEAASIFLSIVAARFGVSPLSLADLTYRTKIYDGRTQFISRLKTEVSNGQYTLPLSRRCTPVTSPWAVLFRVLYSEDRLILKQLLYLISTTSNPTKEVPSAVHLLQLILRKHGAFSTAQFYYSFKLMGSNGSIKDTPQNTYVCYKTGGDGVATATPTAATTDGASAAPAAAAGGDGSATFLSLSGRRSITFNKKGAAREVTLNSVESAEKVVKASQVATAFCNPLKVLSEIPAAKLVVDFCSLGIGSEKWVDSVVRIQTRHTLKKHLAGIKKWEPGSQPAVVSLLNDARPYTLNAATTQALADVRRKGNTEDSYQTASGGFTRLGELDNPLQLIPSKPVTIPDVAAHVRSFAHSVPPALIVALGDGEASALLVDYQLLQDAAQQSGAGAPTAGGGGGGSPLLKPASRRPITIGAGVAAPVGGANAGAAAAQLLPGIGGPRTVTTAAGERMATMRQKRGRSSTLLDRGAIVRRELKDAVLVVNPPQKE